MAPVRNKVWFCVSSVLGGVWSSFQRRSAGLQKKKGKKSLQGITATLLSRLLWPACVWVCVGVCGWEHVHACACFRGRTFALAPFFWRSGHSLGPVTTPAGRQQLRPGCTFSPTARITHGRSATEPWQAELTVLWPRHEQVHRRTREAPISPWAHSLVPCGRSLSGKQKAVWWVLTCCTDVTGDVTLTGTWVWISVNVLSWNK